MFDFDLNKLMDSAEAANTDQAAKRVEAMMFATDIILDWNEHELHYSNHSKYMQVVQKLLENDLYTALHDVDLDVIYLLICD